jgi:trimethylamine--corrinoid protein Co-methyltransferase
LLSGLTIHQLASPGAPVVWGGAPAILDMRTGSAAMGAIETAMLNAACSQVGKFFGLPTHGYLVATDSKCVDAQAGMESATSALLGAMAGINMISGAGMLDSLACHSLEKLVIDADAIGAARRAARGIESRGQDLALSMFAQAGLRGDFLKLPVTRREFRNEQYLPSSVIDRGVGVDELSLDTFARASRKVAELAASYRRPEIAAEVEQRMIAIATREAEKAGLSSLPAIEFSRGVAATESKAP